MKKKYSRTRISALLVVIALVIVGLLTLLYLSHNSANTPAPALRDSSPETVLPTGEHTQGDIGREFANDTLDEPTRQHFAQIAAQWATTDTQETPEQRRARLRPYLDSGTKNSDQVPDWFNQPHAKEIGIIRQRTVVTNIGPVTNSLGGPEKDATVKLSIQKNWQLNGGSWRTSPQNVEVKMMVPQHSTPTTKPLSIEKLI